MCDANRQVCTGRSHLEESVAAYLKKGCARFAIRTGQRIGDPKTHYLCIEVQRLLKILNGDSHVIEPETSLACILRRAGRNQHSPYDDSCHKKCEAAQINH